MTLGKRLWRAGLSLALLLALAFVVVAPPEHCPPVTAEELRESSQAAMDWFVRNQETDGAWLYLYDTDDDTVPDEYNEVRHAGVTMGLYQAAAAGLPGALRSADRGTEWALDRLVERDDWAASGASCATRRSRPEPCSPRTIRHASSRWPASTRSTTPGRRTGPWRCCTGPSPAT